MFLKCREKKNRDKSSTQLINARENRRFSIATLPLGLIVVWRVSVTRP